MSADRPSPMALALAEAERAGERGEVPVGAVLVDAGGAVLARSGNRTEERADPTAHAEVLVLRDAAAQRGLPRLEECDLYVTLEPCAMCAAPSVSPASAVWISPPRIPKAARSSTARASSSSRPATRPEVDGGIDEARAGALLRRFFQERR